MLHELNDIMGVADGRLKASGVEIQQGDDDDEEGRAPEIRPIKNDETRKLDQSGNQLTTSRRTRPGP